MIHKPRFKDETKYLTAEGWPLGTSCWVSTVEAGDFIFHACGLTEAQSYSRAVRLESAILGGASYDDALRMMSKWTSEAAQN